MQTRHKTTGTQKAPILVPPAHKTPRYAPNNKTSPRKYAHFSSVPHIPPQLFRHYLTVLKPTAKRTKTRREQQWTFGGTTQHNNSPNHQQPTTNNIKIQKKALHITQHPVVSSKRFFSFVSEAITTKESHQHHHRT